MTDKNQNVSGKKDAEVISDEALDDVSGGPIYIKIDGITSQKPGIRDGTSNIQDGTSNTIS